MRFRTSVATAVCCGALALAACKSEDNEAKSDPKAAAEETDKQKKGAAKAEEPEKADESKDKKADLAEKAEDLETTTVKGAACDSPKTLKAVEKHTVLSAEGGGCFLVDTVLEVRGKDTRLSVEPGVTIQFAENAGLRVREAALEMKGTADKPVILTGQREMPGFWKGIVIRETDRPGNRLEHVQIKYAGKDSTFDGVEPAALAFDDYHGPSSFKIHDTTISHAEGHGLYAEAKTELDFADNTLTNNKAGAARVHPAVIGELDAGSNYSGNETDRVTVEGGTLEGHEATWPGIDVPYEVIETVELRKDTFVTVEPGATFKFAENKGLQVRRARLKAVGKKGSPIRLTGTREVEGFWKGVVFRQTDSVDNRLEHVVVSYAGAENTFDGVDAAAVMFDDYHGKSSFAIKASTFEHSGGFGLYVEEKTDLDFAENTLTNNKKGAARIHPAVAGQLDAASSYAGNASDRVHVTEGTLKDVEATWPAIDVPYFVEKTVQFREGSFITFAPGLTAEFAEKQGLVVRGAKFKAEGTAEKGIVLTGARQVPGFWGGVVLRQTDSIDNVLKYLTVEYAGASNAFDGVEPAGLMFDDYHGPISYRIGNVTVRESGGAGLHLEKKVTLKSEDCATVKLEADPKVTEASRPFEEVCQSS